AGPVPQRAAGRGLPVVADPAAEIQGAAPSHSDQERDHARPGRDHGTGAGDAARPARARRGDGDHRPVPAAERAPPPGAALLDAGRVQGAGGLRLRARVQPRRLGPDGALQLPRRPAGGGRRLSPALRCDEAARRRGVRVAAFRAAQRIPRGLAADLRDANKSPAGIRSHSLAAARYSGHRRPPANFRHWRAVERRPILRPFTCKRPPRRGDRMTSNRTLLALTLGLLLASPLALVAGADGGIALPSAPTADQSTTSRLVYGLLSDSRYAYRPR